MKIYFVRHGKTEWNILGKVMGRCDEPLNEEGINQAKNTKKFFEKNNIKVDLIISSPLKRTIQTAQIVNEYLKVPLLKDDRIIERDFGEFEGLNRNEFDFAKYWSYVENIKYERAENIQDFFKRIYEFYDDIKVKYADKVVVISSHGGVSIPSYCYNKGIPDMYSLVDLASGNCEVNEYDM